MAMAGCGASLSVAASSSSACSCSSSTPRFCFFSGSPLSIKIDRGNAKVTCRKQDIHPKFFTDAKVFCNGEHVMTTGGTQAEYVVDVWSGNHPFFLGNKTALVLDADRVDKFRQRYGGLSDVNKIPVLERGEIIFEKKKKKGLKGKGGKK